MEILAGMLGVVVLVFVGAVFWQTAGILGIVGAGLMLFSGAAWVHDRDHRSLHGDSEEVGKYRRLWGFALIGFVVFIAGCLAQL